MGNSMFSLLKNCQLCFTKPVHYFAFPPVVYEGSNYSPSSPTFIIAHVFYYIHSSGYEVVSHWGLDLHFPHG